MHFPSAKQDTNTSESEFWLMKDCSASSVPREDSSATHSWHGATTKPAAYNPPGHTTAGGGSINAVCSTDLTGWAGGR